MPLFDVHNNLSPPTRCVSFVVKGTYEYYHYKCDGQDDRVSDKERIVMHKVEGYSTPTAGWKFGELCAVMFLRLKIK